MIDKSRQGTIAEAAETASSLLLEFNLVEKWVEGAIFPSEMAFFLAVCSINGIEVVIETGRQDGYSTEILGRWAERYGTDVISIDLEEEHQRSEQCRMRLAALPVQLVKGNAYVEVGRQTRGVKGRHTALLADGPKGWSALSMLSAALAPHVEVIALHNLAVGLPERDWFLSHGGGFHEYVIPDAGPRWNELRQREIHHALGSQAVRNVEASSLGVMMLDKPKRTVMARNFNAAFGLHQPAMVRLFWRLGAYELTPKLYGLSEKLLGR